MKRRFWSSVFSIVAVCAIAGCSLRGERRAEVPRVPVRAWSLGADLVPVREANEAEREAGRAVVQIEVVSGDHSASGTGFFVSPDGLMITAAHLISAAQCPDSVCVGVQAWRDFTPGGALEKLGRIRLVAEFPELDVSLMRVDASTTVPYLVFSDVLQSREKASVLGHPFGSTLHRLSSRSSLDREKRLIFSGAILPGMSGAPMIHPGSGSVDGVVHSVVPDLGSASKKLGRIQPLGMASDGPSVRHAIERLFPETRGHAVWSVRMFEPKLGTERGVEDFWNADFARASEFSRLLDRWLDQTSAIELPGKTLERAIDRVIDSVLASGVVPPGAQPLLAKIETVGSGNRASAIRLKVLMGLTTREACIRTLSPKSGGPISLRAHLSCFSTSLPEFGSLLDFVHRQVTRRRVSEEERQRWYGYALEVIPELLKYQRLSRVEHQKVLVALQTVVERSDVLRESFAAEGLWARLEKLPTGPGESPHWLTKASVGNP